MQHFEMLLHEDRGLCYGQATFFLFPKATASGWGGVRGREGNSLKLMNYKLIKLGVLGFDYEIKANSRDQYYFNPSPIVCSNQIAEGQSP